MIRKDYSNLHLIHHVLRGGSYFDSARLVRSAYRYYFRPDVRYFFIGLRVAMEIKRMEK
jgi:formylglycine-generating enzyme required for sulfatase activity